MSASVAIFWLVVAFICFLCAMAAVFAVCVRERRRQAPFNDTMHGRESATLQHDLAGVQSHPASRLESLIDENAASDNRVAMMIFGGIVFGAFLAIAVGYVVFFSGLA